MIRIDFEQADFVSLIVWLNDHQGEAQELDKLYKIFSDKLDKMVKHELYTKYKTAPSKEEQEKARLEYLERTDIHKDFRW